MAEPIVVPPQRKLFAAKKTTTNKEEVATNEPAPETLETKDDERPAVELNQGEKDVIEKYGAETQPAQTSTIPLVEQVIQRAHSEVITSGDNTAPLKNVVIAPTTLDSDVIDEVDEDFEEPEIETGPSKKEERTQQKVEHRQSKEYAEESLGEKNAGDAPINPAVSTMSKKERKQNLDVNVEMALEGYAYFKSLIGELFMVSERRMRKMEKKDEVRGDWAIFADASTGKLVVVTLRQFILATNQSIKKACETSPEFREKIRPLLEAEMDKRGLILSSTQTIGGLVAADLFTTGRRLLGIRMNMMQIIQTAKEEHEEQKKTGYKSDRQKYNEGLMDNAVTPTDVSPNTSVTPTPDTKDTTAAPPLKKEDTGPAVKHKNTPPPANTDESFEEPED